MEFASVTFEREDIEAGYAISLAWGLTGNDQPFVFRGFEVVGADPYPNFFDLIQIMDLGGDGSVEFLLEWSDNYSDAFELWQRTRDGQIRRKGFVMIQ